MGGTIEYVLGNNFMDCAAAQSGEKKYISLRINDFLERFGININPGEYIRDTGIEDDYGATLPVGSPTKELMGTGAGANTRPGSVFAYGNFDKAKKALITENGLRDTPTYQAIYRPAIDRAHITLIDVLAHENEDFQDLRSTGAPRKERLAELRDAARKGYEDYTLAQLAERERREANKFRATGEIDFS